MPGWENFKELVNEADKAITELILGKNAESDGYFSAAPTLVGIQAEHYHNLPSLPLTEDNFRKAMEEYNKRSGPLVLQPSTVVLPTVIVDNHAPRRDPAYRSRPRGRNRQRARRRWTNKGVVVWRAQREKYFYTMGQTLILTPAQKKLYDEHGWSSLNGLPWFERYWWDLRTTDKYVEVKLATPGGEWEQLKKSLCSTDTFRTRSIS